MTAGINSIAPMYNPQAGCIGGGNLFGDDIFYGMDPVNSGTGGIGMGSTFGNQPSIFGNGYGMNYGFNQMPPMKEGESLDEYKERVRSYMALQNEMQQFQTEMQVNNQKRNNGINFALTSEEDMVTRQIAILQSKIKANEQDQIMDCYNKLLQSAKQQLKNQGIDVNSVSNDQLKAYVEKLYGQATGKSMTDEIAEHGSGQFGAGFKDGLFGLGWLFTNKRTAKDNIAEITGEPTSRKDKWNRVLGTAVSAILTAGPALMAFGGQLKLGTKILGGILKLFKK